MGKGPPGNNNWALKELLAMGAVEKVSNDAGFWW
jgi:hypothetical protein